MKDGCKFTSLFPCSPDLSAKSVKYRDASLNKQMFLTAARHPFNN